MCFDFIYNICHIVVCDLSICTVFFHIISQNARFSKKIKKLVNTKCVFRFYLQILSESFLILRRIQRDIIINVFRSPSKIPAILVRFLTKADFSQKIFRELLKYKVPWKSAQLEPSFLLLQRERQTDGRTVMTNLMVAFRNFAKGSTNWCAYSILPQV
jgi:hypothetical protein